MGFIGEVKQVHVGQISQAGSKGWPGVQPLSNFDYAGPLTETVLLVNLSFRLGGKKVERDAKKMTAPNAPEANPLIRRSYRDGWEI